MHCVHFRVIDSKCVHPDVSDRDVDCHDKGLTHFQFRKDFGFPFLTKNGNNSSDCQHVWRPKRYQCRRCGQIECEPYADPDQHDVCRLPSEVLDELQAWLTGALMDAQDREAEATEDVDKRYYNARHKALWDAQYILDKLKKVNEKNDLKN